jgi:chitinase
MKEAHAAFAGRFGLSLTIAQDYWYLRGLKPVRIEPYIDFMGLMAYDLHGSWETDVNTLGSKVHPQTDITEIDRDLLPLWFDGVDPGKLNMGIAYYRQTYKNSVTHLVDLWDVPFQALGIQVLVLTPSEFCLIERFDR